MKQFEVSVICYNHSGQVESVSKAEADDLMALLIRFIGIIELIQNKFEKPEGELKT